MKNYFLFKLIPLVFLLFLAGFEASAQFTLSGQVRTRTEYRAGQGTLPLKGPEGSLFTSQRTRLNFGFNAERFKLYSSIQDVRVWGMDASSISNMDGSRLFLHEGWGEIIFSDTSRLFKSVKNFSLKIGRQEIVYDDARLLGNLDWLQQGRRHDAAILKFSKQTWQADLGVAFNQHRERKNDGTLYVGAPITQLSTDGAVGVSAPASTNGIGINYKSMQYLYLAKDIGFTRVAVLSFMDHFQKSVTAVPTAASVRPKVNTRTTTGAAVFSTIKRKHKAEAYAYYQGNQDRDGRTLDAYMAGANILLGVGRKFMVGPGIDFLSGNDLTTASTVNHRFDPLYGTPHKFWGYMDYFYVADAYGLNGNPALSPGLANLFLKFRYKLRDNLTLNLDIHEFYAGNDVPDLSTAVADDKMDRRLGTEIDLILQYNMTKQIGFEGGYAIMLGTNTLDVLKAPAVDQRNTGHWAYVMINIRTDFLGAIADKLKSLTTDVDNLNKFKNESQQTK